MQFKILPAILLKVRIQISRESITNESIKAPQKNCVDEVRNVMGKYKIPNVFCQIDWTHQSTEPGRKRLLLMSFVLQMNHLSWDPIAF